LGNSAVLFKEICRDPAVRTWFTTPHLAFSTKVGASDSEIQVVEATLQETVMVEDYPGDEGKILTANGQVIVL